MHEWNKLTEGVRISERALTAEWIPLYRAEIVHFDYDRVRARNRIPISVVRGRQLPARVTFRSGPGSRSRAVEVLRHGGIVARIIVKAAGGRTGVAIWGSIFVTGSVS